MQCKECNAPTTLTPEEAEVCVSCGLLQDPFFPIISMEVERYVTARAEYQFADEVNFNIESTAGSFIGRDSFVNVESNQFFDRSTLLNQRNQQNTNSSKLNRILRLAESLKAICYKHFNDAVSHEAIKILKQRENQWRNINKYHVFGACIYIACQNLSRSVSFSDIAIAVNNSANSQITSFNEIGKLVKKITTIDISKAEEQINNNNNSNSLPISSSLIPHHVKNAVDKKEKNLPIPSIFEDNNKSSSAKTAISLHANSNCHSIANKTQATIEGIMNKHYITLQLEYSTLQRAIALIPKYLYELEGRKPATIAAACFLKVSDKLTIQSVGKVLRVSRPTLSSALKLCK